jgi:hypothetical protein
VAGDQSRAPVVSGAQVASDPRLPDGKASDAKVETLSARRNTGSHGRQHPSARGHQRAPGF